MATPEQLTQQAQAAGINLSNAVREFEATWATRCARLEGENDLLRQRVATLEAENHNLRSAQVWDGYQPTPEAEAVRANGGEEPVYGKDQCGGIYQLAPCPLAVGWSDLSTGSIEVCCPTREWALEYAFETIPVWTRCDRDGNPLLVAPEPNVEMVEPLRDVLNRAAGLPSGGEMEA